MDDHLLTASEVSDLLGSERLEKLHDCVERAWQRWLVHQDYSAASKRTRATVVSDYIVQEISRAFADDGDVALKQKYGALNMTVAGKMVIRFKKFRGRRLRTSGISTRTRNMFLRQEEVLDGMVVTHLVVGYLLDDLEVATEKISMTCPLGGDNLWQLDLGTTTGGSEDGGIVAPINPGPSDDQDPIIRSTRPAAQDPAANQE